MEQVAGLFYQAGYLIGRIFIYFPKFLKCEVMKHGEVQRKKAS